MKTGTLKPITELKERLDETVQLRKDQIRLGSQTSKYQQAMNNYTAVSKGTFRRESALVKRSISQLEPFL